MTIRIKVDNDTWTARLGESKRPGHRSVVFFCASNGQRPWRVVEVSEERFASQEQLDSLAESDLRKLFADTVSMGAPRTYG